MDKQTELFLKIDELVFEALAKRSSIRIDRVGTLKVELENAGETAGGEASAPRFHIVLTDDQAEHVLEEELLSLQGVTKENRSEIYGAWFTECMKLEDGATIFAVRNTVIITQKEGDIRITPSVKLRSYLNPTAAPVVPETEETEEEEEESGRKRTWWIIGILALIALGVFLFFYLKNQDTYKEEKAAITAADTIPAMTTTDSLPAETIAAELPAAKPAATSGPMWRVVVGSFAIPENAAKLAQKLKKDFPQTQTMPYGAHTIVVIFSGPT